MRHLPSISLVFLLGVLLAWDSHALSLDTLSTEEIYSQSEMVVEATVVGEVRPRVDGSECESLSRLRIDRRYKGGLKVGTVITAWGDFKSAPSQRVIAFMHKGSPKYWPTHPLSSPESQSAEPRMIAWRRCSDAVPYSVAFYGIAVLAMKQTEDLDGEVGVLFPESFIVPPSTLPRHPSSEHRPMPATGYFWVSYKLISQHLSGLAHESDRPKSSSQVWSNHRSTAGSAARNSDEVEQFAVAADRCDQQDTCVLACRRSKCFEGAARGCAQSCFRRLSTDPIERAELWASGATCRLPSNRQSGTGPARSSPQTS